MPIVSTKKLLMLVNSIKIGIVAGAVIATALTVTKPELQATQESRIPDSIDQGSPPSLKMYKYIKAYADTFDIPLNYAFGIAYAETRYEGPFQWKYNPAQTSPTGAEGPMQILLSTARYLNRDKVSRERLRTDIEYNVKYSSFAASSIDVFLVLKDKTKVGIFEKLTPNGSFKINLKDLATRYSQWNGNDNVTLIFKPYNRSGVEELIGNEYEIKTSLTYPVLQIDEDIIKKSISDAFLQNFHINEPEKK